jgi:hypothetical protein
MNVIKEIRKQVDLDKEVNFAVRMNIKTDIVKNVIGRRVKEYLSFIEPTTSLPTILTFDAFKHLILYFSAFQAINSRAGVKRMSPGKV